MKNLFLKNKKNKNKNKGFLMVEVVIATAIILISVLVAVNVASKSISSSKQAIHATEATFLLEEGAEAVRIARDNAWTNISGLNINTDYYPTFSGGTWTLSPAPNTVGIFTRTVRIESVKRDASTNDISANGVDDPGTKLVTVNVSWSEGGVTISKTLSFYLSNIF